MRLRRQRPLPGPPEELMDAFSEEVARLHHEFGENLERCRKLLQMRDAGTLTSEWRLDALISAAELSHTVRTLTDALDGAMDGYEIPPLLLPGTVFGATARLTYALVGFAEQDPEPEQLLSSAELDGLVAQYELEPWIAMFERARAELHAEDA